MSESGNSLSNAISNKVASLTTDFGEVSRRLTELTAGLAIYEEYRQFSLLDPSDTDSQAHLEHLQSIATLGLQAPDAAAHIFFHLRDHPDSKVADEAACYLEDITYFGEELIQTMLTGTAKSPGASREPEAGLIDAQTKLELADLIVRNQLTPKAIVTSVVYSGRAHRVGSASELAITYITYDDRAPELAIAFLCRPDMREAALEVLEFAATSDNPALNGFASRALLALRFGFRELCALSPEGCAEFVAASLEVLGDEPKSADHGTQPRGGASIGGGSEPIDLSAGLGHAHHKEHGFRRMAAHQRAGARVSMAPNLARKQWRV